MKKLALYIVLLAAPFLMPTQANAQRSFAPFAVTPAAPVQAAPVVQQSFNPIVAPAVVPLAQPVNVLAHPVFPLDTLPPKIVEDPLANGKGVKEVPVLAVKPSSSINDKGLMVKNEPNARYETITATQLKLQEGAILLSLRAPSREVSVDTPAGLVLIKHEGDVQVSYIGSVLRIENITARGKTCLVRLQKEVTGGDEKALALAPGYELVVSERALLAGEIRPADNIARRKNYVFENGQIAVNEFSVDSILSASPVVANIIANEPGKRENRVLKDMCKMAAVMNYLHGSGGYKAAPATGIAEKPGAGTQ